MHLVIKPTPLESTFLVDRIDALAIPDITEMTLLTTIAERWRPEYPYAFPSTMTDTVVSNPPGVLVTKPPP